MRVLVPGARGMLGQDVVAELRHRGHEPVEPSLELFDLSDVTSVAGLLVDTFGPLEGVINCAAYTAVDAAESDEQNAYDVNGLGVGFLGSVCEEKRLPLYHLSTDYVFDGESEHGYRENDRPNPLSAYGRSKLAGEQALATNPFARVVRTSWLYGTHGRCFPRTMVDAFRSGKPLRVVADQWGNPTYTADLGRLLVDLLERDPPPGTYHAAGPETVTWYDFAKRAVRAATGEEPEIEPLATEDYPTPARRPRRTVLLDTRLAPLGIPPMRSLDEALADWAVKTFGGIT